MRIGILFSVLVLTFAFPALAEEGATTTSGSATPLTSSPTVVPGFFALSLPEAVNAAAGEITALSCRVEVDCGSTTISCVGAHCVGQDRNCAVGQRGYVDCDGSRKLCPSCNSCGNGKCEQEFGETGQSCPSDCPPCAGFDYSQCEPLYACEYQCVIGAPSSSIGHECCACWCDGESACPICLLPF